MSNPEQILSRLPQAVCDKVKTTLPALRTCKAIAGKFSLEELKKSGINAPAVLVSVLGAKEATTYSGDTPAFHLSMAAYVVTRDGLGAPRDIAAANICQALLTFIPAKRWGEPALGAARDVALHTLVSTKSKNTSVALWAVTWHQPVTFVSHATAPLGLELYVAHAPDGVRADPGDFEQIKGNAP